MCRLFGMHAGRVAVPATFWLIDAPDSLSVQSRLNPDGTGVGCFGPDGAAILDKEPIAAWRDAAFATEARTLRGTTFVAHVRYASTGGLAVANTHPFLLNGRMFAHNGVLQGLAELDARIAELGATELVIGDTDSERMFALITAETARHGGDLETGIISGISWIVDHLPVLALNFVLITAGELWALRYPDTHQLWMLARSAGGPGIPHSLDARSARIHASATELRHTPAVIVASEPMDDDPSWRQLGVGELIRVDATLSITSCTPFPAHDTC